MANKNNYSLHTSSDGLVEQTKQNPLDITSERMLSIEFNAKVVDSDLAGTDIINEVTTTCDEGPGDEDEDVAAVNGPVLQIKKQASRQQVRVGDTVSYRLEITQSRESLIARHIIVEDSIDKQYARIIDGTIVVSDKNQDEIEGWSLEITDEGMTIDTNRDLDDTEIIYVTYDVEITAEAKESAIINTAGTWANNAHKVIDKELVSTEGPLPNKSDIINDFPTPSQSIPQTGDSANNFVIPILFISLVSLLVATAIYLSVFRPRAKRKNYTYYRD